MWAWPDALESTNLNGCRYLFVHHPDLRFSTLRRYYSLPTIRSYSAFNSSSE